MGSASYTIYLSHTILYKVVAGLGVFEVVRSSGFPAEIAILAIMGLICCFSAVYYVYVEGPLYSAAKALVAHRRQN